MSSPQTPQFPPPGMSAATPPGATAKTRKALIIVISLVATLLVALAVVLVLLLTRGTGSLIFADVAADSNLEVPVAKGLDREGSAPQLINFQHDVDNIDISTTDYLLGSDSKTVKAYDPDTGQEIWKSKLPDGNLQCLTNDLSRTTTTTRSKDFVAYYCRFEGEQYSYVILSTRDGKTVNTGTLPNADKKSVYANLLSDGSLVTCANHELTRYRGVASNSQVLWSKPVDVCLDYVTEYSSGWLQQVHDGIASGPLCNIKDGSEPRAAQFLHSVPNETDSSVLTPLSNGNFAANYWTPQGGSTCSTPNSVLLDSQGKALSQIYNNATIKVFNEDTALVSVFDADDNWEKMVSLDPRTGQEQWSDTASKIQCFFGADSQFIWGQTRRCNDYESYENLKNIVLDRKTGKTLATLPRSLVLERTETGFIFISTSADTDENILNLQAVSIQEGKLHTLWKMSLQDVSPADVQNFRGRLYISKGNKCVGYLGYPGND